MTLLDHISRLGYQVLYLTARSFTQYRKTAAYLSSLEEKDVHLPPGPLLLEVTSLLGSLAAVSNQGGGKIEKLDRLRQLFPTNPFYSAYGNADHDTEAYKAVDISPDMIFRMDEDSFITSAGTGVRQSFAQHIKNVPNLYPRVE